MITFGRLAAFYGRIFGYRYIGFNQLEIVTRVYCRAVSVVFRKTLFFKLIYVVLCRYIILLNLFCWLDWEIYSLICWLFDFNLHVDSLCIIKCDAINLIKNDSRFCKASCLTIRTNLNNRYVCQQRIFLRNRGHVFWNA